MEPNTNVDLENLDNAWRILDRLCTKDHKTFINIAPCCDPKILNHVISFSPMSKFTLFGTAIREKNIELVEYMLTCGLFTEQTLCHHVFNNCNIFSYACLADERIGIMLLNSDKISSSTISTSMFSHPFSHTTHGACGGCFAERVNLIECVFKSKKFLCDDVCTLDNILRIFRSFMKSINCPKLIEKSLTHEKLTSDIVENITVNYGCSQVSLFEYYCKSNCPVILKMFLDSDKVTTQHLFLLRARVGLDINSYSEEIKNVLKSHVKFSNIYDETQYDLMVQQNNLEAELKTLEKMLADLKASL